MILITHMWDLMLQGGAYWVWHQTLLVWTPPHLQITEILLDANFSKRKDVIRLHDLTVFLTLTTSESTQTFARNLQFI